MSLSFQKKPETEDQPAQATETAMEKAMDTPSDSKPTTQASAPPPPPTPPAAGAAGAADKAPPPDSPDAEKPDDEYVPPKSPLVLLAAWPDHKTFRPTMFGIAGLVALMIVYHVANLFYVDTLLKAGIESVQKSKYDTATSYISEYTDVKGRTPESDLWLGRTYVFSGAEQQAGDLLAEYNNIDEHGAEMLYMRALAPISASRPAVDNALRLIRGGDQHPYINGALGVIALLDKKYSEAAHQIQTARDHLGAMNGDARENAEKHLRSLYKIYLREIARIPEQTWLLPFAKPAKPQNDLFAKMGFDMGLEGYHNHFIIPTYDAVLSQDMDNADVDSVLESLNYLARINQSPAQADSVLALFAERDDVALLTRYITGYYQIAGGYYADAIDTYQRINQKSPSSYSQAYEGAALWIHSGGEVPSSEVLAAYANAIKLDSKNLTAQNNYGFMLLYAGDLEAATKAIKGASSISSVAPYVVVNRLAIDLVRVRLQSQPTGDIDGIIGSAIDAYPNSAYLLNLAAQAAMVDSDYPSAIKYAKNLFVVAPSPKVILFIANIYRIRGQDRLAIATMIDGQKRYPEDESIRNGLLLAQARGGSANKFNQMIKSFKLPADSPQVLYGKAMLIGETDPKQAATLALQALEKVDDNLKIYILTDLARFYATAQDVKASQETINTAFELSKKLILWGAINGELDAIQSRVQAIDGKADVETVKTLLTDARKRENIVSQIDLCWALMDLEEYKLAITNLEEIRKLVAPEASTPNLFQALIIAYRKTGNLAKAEQTRRQYNLVVAGKYEGAEGNEDSIGTPEATDSKQIFAEINSAMEAKNYQAAINLYSQLIDYPDYFPGLAKPALTYQNRGALYIVIKRYEDAAQDFGKALSIGKDLTAKETESIRYNYVYSLFQTQAYSKAYEEIIKLLPGKPPRSIIYQTMQARILSRLKKFNEAEVIYRKIISGDPSAINYYIELARVFSSSGNFQGGVQVLTDALEIDANNPKTHLEIIKFYKRLGRIDLAKRHQSILKTL